MAAAADRVNASTLTAGYQILVKKGQGGNVFPTRTKTGAVTATVIGKDVVPASGYNRQARYVIQTDQGPTNPVPGIQTFTLVSLPDEDEAPPAPAPAVPVMPTCDDPDHLPGVIGCSVDVKCNGVPAGADLIKCEPISPTSEIGFDQVGQSMADQLLRFLPAGTAVTLYGGESNPYMRPGIRRCAVWQLIAGAHVVTVAHYEGRTPLGGERGYAAILVGGVLVEGCGEISTWQPDTELSRFVAWRIGEALRELREQDYLADTSPAAVPAADTSPAAVPAADTSPAAVPAATAPVSAVEGGDQGDGGNGGEPTTPGPDDSPAPAGATFRTWEELAQHIAPGRFPTVEAPAGVDLVVTTDGAGAWRIHAPGCQHIERDSDGGSSWPVTARDVAGVVMDTYSDATEQTWREFADPRVMPCVTDLPDQDDAPAIGAPAGAPMLEPVRPEVGEVATVHGWQFRPFTVAVTDTHAVLWSADETFRVPLDAVTGAEVLDAAEMRETACLVLAGTHPAEADETMPALADLQPWREGRPRPGQLVHALALNDTAGQRREHVTLIAERVTKLGCGCYGIECHRPGPVTNAPHRAWVNLLTGCAGRHEAKCRVPMPTAEELAAAERIGRQAHADGVHARSFPFSDEVISAVRKRLPAGTEVFPALMVAYDRGYKQAAAAEVRHAEVAASISAQNAAAAAEVAERNPAAQECADIAAHGAASAGANLERRRAELEMYGQVLPELLATLEGLKARGLEAASRQGVTAEDWAAMPYTEREALLARDRRSQGRRAAGHATAEPAALAGEAPALAQASQGDTPAGPETSGSVAVEAPEGRMVKRPKVGAYVWHLEQACEVVAVPGRGGEDIGVRTPDDKRLSLSRNPRAHWLVVPAPTVGADEQDEAAAGDEEPGSIYRLPVEAYTPELDSDTDAEITIRHDHEDGTVIEGSTRGDGVWEIAKAHGMECRRGVIFKRLTRDQFADLDTIGKLAGALREAGHTVAVEVDDVWRPAAVREDARAERVSERAGRLAGRASKQFAEANSRRLAARNIADGMPFGEPTKPGHHSYRRHCRAFERIEANDRASYAARDYAEELARRADAAERNEASKQGGRAIMRRIDVLKTDRRAWIRCLADTDKGTTGYARRCRLHIERLSEDIAFQVSKLGDMAAAGTFVAWSAETVQRGDWVNVGGSWHEVARVNRKGVSVRALYQWHTADNITPVTWDQIHGRRRDGVQLDTPNGDGWPVETAAKVARWADLVSRYQTCTSYDRGDNAEMRKRRHVAQAVRIVLGLPAGASAQEVAAFGQPDTVDGRRARALANLAVYDRLRAGESSTEVAASVTPIGDTVPAWRMPAGEPVDVLPADLVIGDIVAGVIDGFSTMRTVSTSIVGPVESAPVHEDRRESGDWYHVTIGGEPHELRSHRWLKVHRAGNR